MIKRLLKSVREYKKASILSIVFIIVEVVMEVIIPFIMAKLLDDGINAGNIDAIYKYGIILVIAAIISLVAGTIAGIISSKASSGFAKNLRHDMYYKVQDFSFANIDKFSTSSIITRLTTDVSNIQNAYQMIIRITVRAPLMLLFSLIMAMLINKKMSIIFLILIPFLSTILFLITKKVHPLFENVFKTYDELNNSVQENVRGIRVVKSFTREEYEKQKFNKVSTLIYKKFIKAEKIITYINPTMQLSMYAGILCISWFGAKFITKGTLTTGELTSLISYGSTILASLMMISMVYVMLTLAIASAKRITEILDEDVELVSPKNGIKEVKNGDIVFDNVTFAYSRNAQKKVLKNINLEIKSGEVIGVLGSTGSGKSSFINLISRLYDVTEGSILVGDVNVKEYNLKSLRDSVAVVLQKNVLFSGTIKDNLKWGNKNATDKEIKEACEIACASEFINGFEEKYDYVLDEGATNLSGGQRQRLCIARALLKKPKILILDDSTSAVDTRTDAKIRESFKKYIPEVTKIIIAQRVASVENADKVIILDNGKISAFDTPKNLLKNNKIYQEIYYSQKKGEK